MDEAGMLEAEAVADPPSARAWLDIPRLALRLLGRHWPALLFWFFAGQLAYSLLLDGALLLARHSRLLADVALAVLVVSQLVAYIGMFLAVRPGLPELSQRDVPEIGAPRDWTRAVALVLLPFFAYYDVWGLLDGLDRQFTLDYILYVPDAQKEAIDGVLALHGLWLALLVSVAIRHFARRRAKHGGGFGWMLLATVCEAYWVFVGLRAIEQGLALGWHWWQGRVAWMAVLHAWDSLGAASPWVAQLGRWLDPAWHALGTAAWGAVLPMAWLVIAATIYGMDLNQSRGYDRHDEHFARLGARYTAVPELVRWVAGEASSDWSDRGIPLVNSVRLVLRAGVPAVVVLCVLYQALVLVDSWAWRWLVLLVGPHAPDWWNRFGQAFAMLVGGPLSTRPSMLTEPLFIVLLAATFDCAVARVTWARRTGAG